MTWKVDWGSNSTYRQSQVIEPVTWERLGWGGSIKIRTQGRVRFKGKGLVEEIGIGRVGLLGGEIFELIFIICISR